MLAAVHVAPGTFFAIIAVSALAGTVTAVASEHGVLVPVVVVELLLGVADIVHAVDTPPRFVLLSVT